MNFDNEGRGLASEGSDKREAKISSRVSEAGGGEADPAIVGPLRTAEGTNCQAAGTPQVGSAQNDENDRPDQGRGAGDSNCSQLHRQQNEGGAARGRQGPNGGRK